MLAVAPAWAQNVSLKERLAAIEFYKKNYDVLFKEEASEEDLLLLSEEEEDQDLGTLTFNWYKTKAKYRRKITE